MGEDDGKQAYKEVIYLGPSHTKSTSHRKLYGEVIRLKQARIRRRLVPPYQAYGFSTGKKTPYNLSTNVETKGKLISNSFPFAFPDH